MPLTLPHNFMRDRDEMVDAVLHALDIVCQEKFPNEAPIKQESIKLFTLLLAVARRSTHLTDDPAALYELLADSLKTAYQAELLLAGLREAQGDTTN